jgi:ssDNA-binding Zn-finger/Zn-ribbon topoisomerase 1
MNVRSEPVVRPALDPGKSARSLTSKVKCATPKNLKQAPQQRLHFRVSVTGRWRSQESKLSNTGVPKCRNAKSQKPETDALLEVMDTGISDTGRWRSQRLSTSGVPKCRNAKSRKTQNRRITRSNGYRDFGYREIEMSRLSSSGVPKTRNAKW